MANVIFLSFSRLQQLQQESWAGHEQPGRDAQVPRVLRGRGGGQQGGGEGLTSTNRPDSTSWPEESAAPSSTSPDYGANGQAHFPNDTTLNFQVNLFDPITRCSLVDKNPVADTFDLSAKPNKPKLKNKDKDKLSHGAVLCRHAKDTVTIFCVSYINEVATCKTC